MPPGKGEIFHRQQSLLFPDKVDLSLSEEGLMIYRDFNIKQEFEMNEDSLVLLEATGV